MVSDAERNRLQKLFSDTISLLCRSGFPGTCAHRVDALIGVTLDNQEVVLVNYSEDFCHKNECSGEAEARTEITDKNKSSTPSVQVQEKANMSLECRTINVKDECTPDTDQGLCNTPALGPNGFNGTDIKMTDFHDNFYNPVEYTELQNTIASNQGCSEETLPESKQISALESDSDCLLIKTEMPEDSSQLCSIPTEGENFIAPSADGTGLPSSPAFHRSACNGPSPRIKQVHSMQRRTWWHPYGSKLYRPQQRYHAVPHSASHTSQVSYDIT